MNAKDRNDESEDGGGKDWKLINSIQIEGINLGKKWYEIISKFII